MASLPGAPGTPARTSTSGVMPGTSADGRSAGSSARSCAGAGALVSAASVIAIGHNIFSFMQELRSPDERSDIQDLCPRISLTLMRATASLVYLHNRGSPNREAVSVTSPAQSAGSTPRLTYTWK